MESGSHTFLPRGRPVAGLAPFLIPDWVPDWIPDWVPDWIPDWAPDLVPGLVPDLAILAAARAPDFAGLGEEGLACGR
jgi:hypothetical protein